MIPCYSPRLRCPFPIHTPLASPSAKLAGDRSPRLSSRDLSCIRTQIKATTRRKPPPPLGLPWPHRYSPGAASWTASTVLPRSARWSHTREPCVDWTWRAYIAAGNNGDFSDGQRSVGEERNQSVATFVDTTWKKGKRGTWCCESLACCLRELAWSPSECDPRLPGCARTRYLASRPTRRSSQRCWWDSPARRLKTRSLDAKVLRDSRLFWDATTTKRRNGFYLRCDLFQDGLACFAIG